MLTIKDLNVSFFTPAGEVKALNGVSFEVLDKQVVGVVGESGCGKSVTSSVIMGLLQKPGKVLSGELMFNNNDMLNQTEKSLRKILGNDIAMIFQDPMTSLNPLLTIGNQIMEMILLHTNKTKKEALQHAIHMLELVGINNPEQRVKQYPHEFSGGMRQRVMIAMALSCNPKLLIADEPTTALDVTIQAQILDLMKKLKNDTNASVILITHDLGVVADTCDKVVVMYAGRVVEQGSIDDIFYKTAHPYTSGLLACLPRLDDKKDEKLEIIEGSPVDLLALPEGCPFAPRCKHTMKICLKSMPPTFKLSETHTSSCWLNNFPDGLSYKEEV